MRNWQFKTAWSFPAVVTQEQRRLFNLPVDTAERQDSLVTLLIEVHADGTVDVRDWFKSEPGSSN
jgi:hypothetical protein